MMKDQDKTEKSIKIITPINTTNVGIYGTIKLKIWRCKWNIIDYIETRLIITIWKINLINVLEEEIKFFQWRLNLSKGICMKLKINNQNKLCYWTTRKAIFNEGRIMIP